MIVSAAGFHSIFACGSFRFPEVETRTSIDTTCTGSTPRMPPAVLLWAGQLPHPEAQPLPFLRPNALKASLDR
jgi:hypothetical protein